MSLSLALRWKWGRRRNTGCPSGAGVAEEEPLVGKGSKNLSCIFWLEGLKGEMDVEEKVRSKVFLFVFHLLRVEGMWMSPGTEGLLSASISFHTGGKSPCKLV